MKRIAAFLIALILVFTGCSLAGEESIVGVWKVNKYITGSDVKMNVGSSNPVHLFEFTAQGTVLHHSSKTWRYTAEADAISVTQYTRWGFLTKSAQKPIRCSYRILSDRLMLKGYLGQEKWQLFNRVSGSDGLVGVWAFEGLFNDDELENFLNDAEGCGTEKPSLEGTPFEDILNYTLEFKGNGRMIDTSSWELIKYRFVGDNTIMLASTFDETTDLLLDCRLEGDMLILTLTDEESNGEPVTMQLYLEREEE